MKHIRCNTRDQVIDLVGNRSTYSIKLYNKSLPLHLHWGAKTELVSGKPLFPSEERAFSIRTGEAGNSFFIEDLQCEYGFAENGDFRLPAFRIRDGRNYPITGPFELETRTFEGRKSIPDLPSARINPGISDGTESLEIDMFDPISSLTITLSYTVFPAYDAVTRYVRFRNRGTGNIRIEKAASLSIDMINQGFELLSLHGAWARERQVVRRLLEPGITAFGSTRGTSSHQANPSFAVLGPGTDEFRGEARGFSLVYSGNFLAELELNQDENLRINLGIHPDTFEWQLPPGETFSTPEAVMIYADDGLNGLSDRFHRFIRERIVPPRFSGEARPILFNNWEATYFDFKEKDLLNLADTASDLGLELFVLDDGWFEGRNSDRSSLGDWYEDPKKLPGGLGSLGKKILEKGLRFGLWLEPEMVSLDSGLAREHPDWYISNPDRPVAEGRNQLVLDLSRGEVCDFLISMLDRILGSAPISYVKWDMNRYLTNVAALHLPAHQQREVYHRYVLGLYRILDRITEGHPDVLFEGCSGGGGRLDLGILYYMPQYWTSDNTDAVSRIRIQYGTSIFYPPVVMGSHVSAVPNHQVGRTTPIDLRGHVAMSGNFGYELDLRAFPPAELDALRGQVSFYKKYRRTLQFGRFIRLVSPFTSRDAAWMFIAPENGFEIGSAKGSEIGSEAGNFILFWFRLQAEANMPVPRVRLAGLDPEAVYHEIERDLRYTGSELMNRGLMLPPPDQEFVSRMIVFEIEKSSPAS